MDTLLTSFLLASPPPKTLWGAKLADSTLYTTSPRVALSPRGTMQRMAAKTWRRRHGQASQRPIRLRDIVEAGPHGPSALLLIPLKPRDVEHALSSFPPRLASILLAPKPKEARPPHPRDDHERQRETLLDLGDARSKSREVGEETESHNTNL